VAATCKPKMADLNASVPHVAYNIYPLWYARDGMAAVVDGFFRLNAVTTLALSEYGAGGSVFQHENPAHQPETVALFHPEEWQTFVHMSDLRAIQDDARLWGSFVWAMFDFAADARREGDRHGVNDKGLVTRDRTTAKDAYFLYKVNWNPEPLVHLCGKRMVQAADQTVDVTAFSNVGDVTLTVNGEIVGTQTPDAIRSVTFGGVRLAAGENEICVTAGGRTDRCIWIAPAADKAAIGGR